MENASKALLIAGAILICILLIAVAMYIYNSANATIKSAASQMSQQEKDIYNSKVKPYVNEGVKGSEVKSMIDEIISMNQANAGEQGKFIGITAGTIVNYSSQSALKAACQKASIYKEENTETVYNEGNNTEANVKAATEEMTKLKKILVSQKNYDVTAKMFQGIYVWINITQSGSAGAAAPSST